MTTAPQALEIAEKQQNNELATALRGNIALYEHQAQTGPSAVSALSLDSRIADDESVATPLLSVVGPAGQHRSSFH